MGNDPNDRTDPSGRDCNDICQSVRSAVMSQFIGPHGTPPPSASMQKAIAAHNANVRALHANERAIAKDMTNQGVHATGTVGIDLSQVGGNSLGGSVGISGSVPGMKGGKFDLGLVFTGDTQGAEPSAKEAATVTASITIGGGPVESQNGRSANISAQVIPTAAPGVFMGPVASMEDHPGGAVTDIGDSVGVGVSFGLGESTSCTISIAGGNRC